LKIALKNISTLCFLLLWSVQETTCFIKKHKLIEFQAKLQEMVASSSPIPPPSPAVSQTKQVGSHFPLQLCITGQYSTIFVYLDIRVFLTHTRRCIFIDIYMDVHF
jgi:hypothetical protein